MRILVVTSHHARYDVRIFRKQCRALSGAGHDVTLAVADGRGDEVLDGVKIVDVGRNGSRVDRYLKAPYRLFGLARGNGFDVIHFHDGLFLPWGVTLALLGKRVTYDVHEDYPRQANNLPFAWPARKMMSLGYSTLEWIGSRVFTRIVTATPKIARRFPEKKTTTVRNYPIEIQQPPSSPHAERDPIFAYVGGITRARGYVEMGVANSLLNEAGTLSCLHLAGDYLPPSLAKVEFGFWEIYMVWHGRLPHNSIPDFLAKARAGLCVLHPTGNYRDSLPVKLFEYMAVGLPVIASNFPLWREIVEGNDCGLCVDPTNPANIAEAMKWLLDNPDEAEAMGRRGRQAIEKNLNWEAESRTLLDAYRQKG